MTTARAPYQRVILKLSGELFGDRQGQGLSGRMLERFAGEVRDVHALGAKLGVVLGGGNFFRGGRSDLGRIRRTTGDDIGMLATLINALAFRDALRSFGTPAAVLSAVDAPKLAERFSVRAAERLWAEGQVVILAGGTGNPFFTTDTGAALRARELEADLLLKATNVDGVYSADPRANPKARKYARLSYATCVKRRLAVMDLTAFELCAAASIPIVVFDVRPKGNIKKAVMGETIGTFVGG